VIYDLLVYCLAAFGLAFIVGSSKITLRMRNAIAPLPKADRTLANGLRRFFIELIECAACFGFWEGLAALYFFSALVPRWWILPLLTSGVNLLLAKIAGLMNEAIE